jgi:hexosaminidase
MAGLSGKDVVATIDFGQKTVFRSLFQYLENKGSWIHLAKSAKIFISDDNKNFKLIKEIGKRNSECQRKNQTECRNQNAKYLKVKLKMQALFRQEILVQIQKHGCLLMKLA